MFTKMKTTKFFSALLTLTILFGVLALPAAASQDIKVVLNGQELKGDVMPVIVDGRVLLPMRTVAEAMGCSVEWDDHFQRVIVQTNAGWEGWVEEYYVDEAQLNWDGMLTLRNRYNLRIFIYVDENFAYIYDDTWSSYYDPMLAPFVFPEDPPTVFGTDVKRIPLDVTQE